MKTPKRPRVPTLAEFDKMLANNPLDQPQAQLRESIMQYYRVYREHRPDFPRGEQPRRESALDQIKEHLDFRPLETFKAEHLEVLVMLIAYWRELETEPPFGAGAPKPDSLQ